MSCFQSQPFENLFCDFSVSYKDTPAAQPRAAHIHKDFELLYVLSDGLSCQINETVYPLRRKTLLLFNNMDLHRIISVDTNEHYIRYVVSFKPELISGLSSDQTNLLHCFYYRPFDVPQLLELSDDEHMRCQALLEALQRADQEKEYFGSDLMIQFLLGETLILVNRIYLRHHMLSVRGGEKYQRIYEIIQYIHENYADELTLDALCTRFYINKSYLCSLFHQVTGITPMQYLINCRMMKAKHLLAAQRSVEETAEAVGYANLSHFSRSFKNLTGVRPKQYQLQARSNAER